MGTIKNNSTLWIQLSKYRNCLNTHLGEKVYSTGLEQRLDQEQLVLEPCVPLGGEPGASSLSSIISNYDVIQAILEEALHIAKDSETHARIIGIMSTFEYLFGVMLRELILKHYDNLSNTLQTPL